METNCVSLKTAQRLKAAGFVQDSVWLWRLHKPNGANKLVERIDQEYDNERFARSPEASRFREENDFFAAPTAQDIADKLIEDEYQLRVEFNHGDMRWYAYYGGKSGGQRLEIDGTGADTMAEALAGLWLKLNEKESR